MQVLRNVIRASGVINPEWQANFNYRVVNLSHRAKLIIKEEPTKIKFKKTWDKIKYLTYYIYGQYVTFSGFSGWYIKKFVWVMS